MALKVNVFIGLIVALVLLLVFSTVFNLGGTHTNEATLEKISLDGQWHFYWDTLLLPSQVNNTTLIPDQVKVPGSWNRDSSYPMLGKATYVRSVALPHNQTNYSIYFESLNSVGRVYFNGSLVDSIGQLSPNYSPRLKSLVISVPAGVSTLQIVVQIENYSYFTGGIVRSPVIQKTDLLFRKINRRSSLQSFLIGCLLAMGVYQFILYQFNRGVKSHLWLSLLCFSVALRSATTLGGSLFLPELFSGVPVDSWRKVEFFSVYSSALLVVLYVRFVFKKVSPLWPFLFFVPITLFLCATVIFTTQPYYGTWLFFFLAVLLLALCYAAYVILRASKTNDPQAKILKFGLFISFPFIVVEVLQMSRIVSLQTELPFLVETSLVAFLNFQVVLLASHHANTFSKLKRLNVDLEKIVQERTTELTRANKIKDKLLSIVSHDIKSPLYSLKSLFSLFKRKEISRDEFLSLMDHVEGELAKTTLLVDNLLSWTADQLKGVAVKKEKFDILALLELNIQLFQSVISKKHLEVKHNLHEPFRVISDQSIINTVLRNLIANAIKFTKDQGLIKILVVLEEKILTLEIEDNGIGMDEKTLQSLADPANSLVHQGTANETGTGLGIMLCRELVRRLEGEIQIESKKNVGSKFKILIPVA